MPIENYFRGTDEHPHHLSVGAVIINDQHDVLCHYYTEVPESVFGEKTTDIHLLMTESVEMGERLEDAALRGIGEEFGIEGKVRTFLGSVQSVFYRDTDTKIAKTTLYFLVEYTRKRQELQMLTGWESTSVPKWLPIDELIRIKEDERARKVDLHNNQLGILRSAEALLMKSGQKAINQ